MALWARPGKDVSTIREVADTNNTRSVKNAEHNDPRNPCGFTQDAVDAYEKLCGFYGIGKKLVEHGRWIIVTKEEVPCR